LSAYRLPSPYDRPPLRRRASGLGLAFAVNLALLLVLLGLGRFVPVEQKDSRATVVDLIPESHDSAAAPARPVQAPRVNRPVPKPPPIVLPVKPTIAPPPRPLQMIEMTRAEMAAANIGNLPKAGAGSGSDGDSEEVGRGPHGETLYAAEWVREPTHAEMAGYLPRDAPDGWGVVACKTIPGNRVQDCVELGNSPGSHLARALRQAAWQFRVRPPRKNGRALVGEWVRIHLEYYGVDKGG
jgi:protein TonB